ncbi:mesoderm induction early response protein 1 [Lingula anatina]|uniref:Mesoderm induction early response protein 1 n=1 Tax=Lingula anatina TaxID=7574 RepID=A0A1S3JUR2_LINAN|nr:mesoderm induction early response protein 1 [Lingula anatina]|eukprot:XP_013413829.1 mesoderm induction early response protein 1 [Lingula anatina]
MAEPTTSESGQSSPDTDQDFEPTVDMLVHEFDDEHTLEEEEALSNESCGSEVDDLQKESEMPLEELLAMYGYGGGGPPADTRSSSEEEILSNRDLTLDKEEIARDLLKNSGDDDEEDTSVDNLLDSVEVPSHTSRLLRSSNLDELDDESEDEDYEPVAEDDWKKTIQVGSDYQAQIPEGLCKYGDAPAYENEDRLLWDNRKLSDEKVEKYLAEIQNQNLQGAQGVNAIPEGAHIRDDEQALYLLLQCGHNLEEALRRRKMQAVPPTDPMSLWSEEECRNFENGLRTYGKDFYLIQQNKVRTRSVGELVQFYYLWKKTERHDVFANKTRLEKKKYILHPGVTDYMDRFLDDAENPPQAARDRASSPVHSLLWRDPKRHHLHLRHIDNMESGPISPQKMGVDLSAGATVTVKPEPRMGHQSLENTVHIADVVSPHHTPYLEEDHTEPDAKRVKLESNPKESAHENDKLKQKLSNHVEVAFSSVNQPVHNIGDTAVSSIDKNENHQASRVTESLAQ